METTSSATSTADEQPLSWLALLASLPSDALLHIVGLAAYQMSAWAALDAAATQAVIDKISRRE